MTAYESGKKSKVGLNLPMKRSRPGSPSDRGNPQAAYLSGGFGAHVCFGSKTVALIVVDRQLPH